jgi:hypothetical protein
VENREKEKGENFVCEIFARFLADFFLNFNGFSYFFC